jgi:hypothetical protein
MGEAQNHERTAFGIHLEMDSAARKDRRRSRRYIISDKSGAVFIEHASTQSSVYGKIDLSSSRVDVRGIHAARLQKPNSWKRWTSDL